MAGPEIGPVKPVPVNKFRPDYLRNTKLEGFPIYL